MKMKKLSKDAEQVRTDLQSELRSYERLKKNLHYQKEQYNLHKSKYIEQLKEQDD